jgi:hypothetical protein
MGTLNPSLKKDSGEAFLNRESLELITVQNNENFNFSRVTGMASNPLPGQYFPDRAFILTGPSQLAKMNVLFIC